jgi:transcriptional regulator with XRE-family HTH domain
MDTQRAPRRRRSRETSETAGDAATTAIPITTRSRRQWQLLAISRTVKERMRALDMTQEKLHEKSGLSMAWIGRLMSERSVIKMGDIGVCRLWDALDAVGMSWHEFGDGVHTQLTLGQEPATDPAEAVGAIARMLEPNRLQFLVEFATMLASHNRLDEMASWGWVQDAQRATASRGLRDLDETLGLPPPGLAPVQNMDEEERGQTRKRTTGG